VVLNPLSDPLGYYDYGATLTLEKPLVISGPPSGEHMEIAYNLAALTGLRLDDTDRLVEHRAGCSLWELVRDGGEADYRRWESEFLQQALQGRPSSIVVIGDGGLVPAANLDSVLSGGTLVYLHLPLNAVFWNMRRRRGQRHPAFPQPPENMDQLRPMFDARRPGWLRAHITLDLENRQPHQTTLELRDCLAGL
jgi:shikimate kinase